MEGLHRQRGRSNGDPHNHNEVSATQAWGQKGEGLMQSRAWSPASEASLTSHLVESDIMHMKIRYLVSILSI